MVRFVKIASAIDNKRESSGMDPKVSKLNRSGSLQSAEPIGPTFKRTRKGSEELVLRTHGLSEDQRKLLLYANGNRGIADLERLVPEVQENPEIMVLLEELEFLVMHDPEIELSSPAPQPQHRAETPAASAPPAPPLAEGALDAIKRTVTEDLRGILGTDSTEAVDRIMQVNDIEEFKQVARKLDGLIRVYAGQRKAELFTRNVEKLVAHR